MGLLCTLYNVYLVALTIDLSNQESKDYRVFDIEENYLTFRFIVHLSIVKQVNKP